MVNKPARLNKPLVNRIIGSGVERVDQMLANPANFRVHPDNQQQALAGMIDDIGFIRSVTVNKRTGAIVDGHLRVTLALRSGVAELPVEYVDLTEDEEAKALLSLDPIAAMAATDKAKLDELMRQVQSDDERVTQMIADLAEQEGLEYGQPAPDDPGAQIDRAEELRQKWGVELGQLWQLGEHRLICGDCTDRAVVERVMNGGKAFICPTDPPYNVGINYKNDETDEMTGEAYESFTRAWFGLACQYSERQIITPGCNNLALWLRWFDAFYVAAWTKTNAMTHGFVSRFFCWEPVVFFGGRWFEGNEQIWKRSRANDVFAYNVSAQAMPDGSSLTPLHPCPKPIDIILDFLENYSDVDCIVYEPFSGSGTTLIACERLSRKCRAIEISPAYVAVALERWSQMTGKQPERLDS